MEGTGDGGCTTYAKATLCPACPITHLETTNALPKQFSNMDGVRLVFMTEAQMFFNRSLVFLLKKWAKAQRVMIILDEAQLSIVNSRSSYNQPIWTNTGKCFGPEAGEKISGLRGQAMVRGHR